MKKTLIALGVIVVLLIGGIVSFVNTLGPDYAFDLSLIHISEPTRP